MNQCVFSFTETFTKSFDAVVDHLLFYNEQSSQVIEEAELAIAKAQQIIEQHPQAYPVNQDIAEYGLNYREAIIKRGKNGFRILYVLLKTEDGYQVNFELFLLQKMSVQKALSQFLLLH